MLTRDISFQFLRQQAELSATEITADSVKEFATEVEEDSQVEVNHFKGVKQPWEKFFKSVTQMTSFNTKSCKDIIQFDNGSIQIPKVNGNHNKSMQHVTLKVNGETLSQGNGVAKMIRANMPVYRDVLPGLESWQSSKVTSWHDLEGNSIQWLSIVCIDRKGISLRNWDARHMLILNCVCGSFCPGNIPVIPFQIPPWVFKI